MIEYKWDGKFDDVDTDYNLDEITRKRILLLLKTFRKVSDKERQMIASGLHSGGFRYSDYVSLYGQRYSEWRTTTYTIGTVIWMLKTYYGSKCLNINQDGAETLNKFF